MPHMDAGLRTEPPVSVPSAAGTMPAASATPEPLEEPPGKRRPRQIERRPADSELVRGELAHHDAAGRHETRRYRGVRGRHVVDQHLRMCGRRQAGKVYDVLEGEGYAMQGAPRAASRDLTLRLARSGHGEIGCQADEGVTATVEPTDAIEQGLRVLDGGELALADHLRRIGNTQIS